MTKPPIDLQSGCRRLRFLVAADLGDQRDAKNHKKDVCNYEHRVCPFVNAPLSNTYEGK